MGAVEFRFQMRLTCPVWLMPGNHDSIDAMRYAFVDHTELTSQIDEALSPYVPWVREVAGLRLIALDTADQRMSPTLKTQSPPTGSLTPVFARPGTNCRLTKTGA